MRVRVCVRMFRYVCVCVHCAFVLLCVFVCMCVRVCLRAWLWPPDALLPPPPLPFSRRSARAEWLEWREGGPQNGAVPPLAVLCLFEILTV